MLLVNASTLSVRFENVLPSDDLLGFARRVWAGLDCAPHAESSQAMLSIARARGELFRARLAFRGITRPVAEAHDTDPFLAIRDALDQLSRQVMQLEAS